MRLQMGMLFLIMAVTLAFFRANDYIQSRRLCIMVVTVIMTCFSGFRSWWMGDLIKYYTLYNSCNGPDWSSAVFDSFGNIGIRLFFRGMGAIGISYDICLFIIAAFSAATLSLLIFRYSPYPYWSYLMYIGMGFYLFTYSGLKQTIAMGFIILAAIGLYENRLVKFLFWVTVAGVFHAPAFIFLAAYPAAKKKVDFKYVVIVLTVVLFVFLFRDQIVSFFSQAYYEDEKMFTASKFIGGRFVVMVIIMLISVVLRPPRYGDRIYSQTLSLMVIAAIIQTFSVYNNVYTRLADYYYQFVVLFMPMMLESGDHQMKMKPDEAVYRVRRYSNVIYILMGIGVSFVAVWLYRNTVQNTHLVSAFRFFWQIDPYSLYGS